MKKIMLFVLVGFLFLMTSCSSTTFTSDFDNTVDFTQFKTFSYYGWADGSDKILNPFDKERLETAFGDEFTKRGLTFVKEGGDITVALFIHTQEKQETTATTTGMGGMYGGYGGYYGYGPGWGWGGGYGGGMSQTTVNTYDYTVGTLVCDVFDSSEKKLIWEGTAQGTVDDNPQSRENNIPKVVAKLMNQYPVPVPKK